MFIDQTLGWYVGNYTRIAGFKNRPNNLKVYLLMSDVDMRFVQCSTLGLMNVGKFGYSYIHLSYVLWVNVFYIWYMHLCIYTHRESERNRVSCIDFYIQKRIIHWRSTYYLGKQKNRRGSTSCYKSSAVILMMVKKSQGQPPWDVENPLYIMG